MATEANDIMTIDELAEYLRISAECSRSHHPGPGQSSGALSERQDRAGIPDASHLVAAGAYGPDAERDPRGFLRSSQ